MASVASPLNTFVQSPRMPHKGLKSLCPSICLSLASLPQINSGARPSLEGLNPAVITSKNFALSRWSRRLWLPSSPEPERHQPYHYHRNNRADNHPYIRPAPCRRCRRRGYSRCWGYSRGYSRRCGWSARIHSKQREVAYLCSNGIIRRIYHRGSHHPLAGCAIVVSYNELTLINP